MISPRLTDHVPEWVRGLPPDTCGPAGMLTETNSGWRTVRPIIDAGKCKGCYRCYLYCPDGAIRMKEGKAEVDYDFCKGCGICARMCQFGCITMEEER